MLILFIDKDEVAITDISFVESYKDVKSHCFRENLFFFALKGPNPNSVHLVTRIYVATLG